MAFWAQSTPTMSESVVDIKHRPVNLYQFCDRYSVANLEELKTKNVDLMAKMHFFLFHTSSQTHCICFKIDKKSLEKQVV